MKVAALLDERRKQWNELEQLCAAMEVRAKRKLGGRQIGRFASLYRAACADLALADSYQLPPNTVRYLHQLVGRAHNQLYRSRTFRIAGWASELLFSVPQRLYKDNCLRLAFAIFFGFFAASMYLSYSSPEFAESVVGRDALTMMEEMHSESVSGTGPNQSAAMVGFYIRHNPSIGLQCFAAGLLLGVGGIFITLSNAVQLGTIFGHMATTPSAENFFEFVTAHAPFELTAIVLCSAAGMRLGFSLIDTGGMGRVAALRRATYEAMPAMWGAMILFVLAALIEGVLSPSQAPYAFKLAVAGLSSGLLLFYFVLLGHPPSDDA